MTPFHLAFAVADLEATRTFYIDKLGCAPGRESPGAWLDFDFFGHQLSAHLKPVEAVQLGTVDVDAVPIPHFGAVLDMVSFNALAVRLQADAETDWVLAPKTRMKGEPGEQATMFVRDPSGNCLEFKGFANRDGLFAT